MLIIDLTIIPIVIVVMIMIMIIIVIIGDTYLGLFDIGPAFDDVKEKWDEAMNTCLFGFGLILLIRPVHHLLRVSY